MQKNILIVVDNLAMGGVTKVLSNMLNKLDYSKYNIDLLVLHYYESMEISLPPNINIIKGSKFFNVIDTPFKGLLAKKNIFKIFHKIFLATSIKTNYIKKIILKDRKNILKNKYDIEIAFCDGFSQLYTAYGDTPFKITWLHSDVKVMNYSKRYVNVMKKALQKFSCFVGVSDKVGNAYKEIYNIDSFITIPNLIDDEEIIQKSKENMSFEYNKNTINLISVGRLDYSKNYEMLIRTHKKLIDDGFKITTYIVGDGTQKTMLENLIENLNLKDNFILLGQKQNPYPYVKNADLFVLSSRYEGLPTVVLEALSLHVPCLSTEVAGITSVLKNDYGIITKNDENDFYENLKYLLENKEKLNDFKNNLNDYKYNNEEILNKINALLCGGTDEKLNN